MTDTISITGMLLNRHDRYGWRLDLPGRGDDWQTNAACQNDENPDAWFPEGRHTPKDEAARAKRVCAGCPVAQTCFDTAIAADERDGIWGGVDFGANKNPSARRLESLKNARRRITHPRKGSYIKGLEKRLAEQRHLLDQAVKEVQQ